MTEWIDRSEEQELASRFQVNGEIAARNRLIEVHMPLVPRVVSKLGRSFMFCWDDIVGFGIIGLVKAADRYRPGSRARFSSVATGEILSSASRGLLKVAFSVVPPVRSRALESSSRARAFEPEARALLMNDAIPDDRIDLDPSDSDAAAIRFIYSMSDEEIELIRYRYGIDGYDVIGFKKMARAMGRSVLTLRRMERKILEAARVASGEHGDQIHVNE